MPTRALIATMWKPSRNMLVNAKRNWKGEKFSIGCHWHDKEAVDEEENEKTDERCVIEARAGKIMLKRCNKRVYQYMDHSYKRIVQ